MSNRDSLRRDSPEFPSNEEIRAMNGADLSRLGTDSLKQHLIDSASRAHVRHKALSGDHLYAYLSDSDYVRYPVRLAYEVETLAPHQFAQPEVDQALVSPAYVLYIHPQLKDHDLMTRQAIAFFIPIINFGKIVTEDMALLYGATLLGIPVDDFYQSLCKLADFVGATTCISGETNRIV